MIDVSERRGEGNVLKELPRRDKVLREESCRISLGRDLISFPPISKLVMDVRESKGGGNAVRSFP